MEADKFVQVIDWLSAWSGLSGCGDAGAEQILRSVGFKDRDRAVLDERPPRIPLVPAEVTDRDQ